MTSRKRVGFIAGAGIGTAAAVALRRRWSGKEQDPPTGAHPEETSERGRAFLDHLTEAVRIETMSHDDRSHVDFAKFEEFRRFLAETYPLIHERLEVETVADHSLLYTWAGTDTDAKPLVLMAHQDVVPVEPGTEEEWEEPPFSGAATETYLYGRGALDDKGSLIGIFEAVESLLENGFEPGCTVYLVLGHDEEAGGTGAAAIAELLAERGVHASLVLDEGGAVAVDFFPGATEAVALIGIGEKGYADVVLTARGTGGHSSAPPRSTAVGMVADAVRAIERNPMPARLDTQRGFFTAISQVLSGPRSMALRRSDLLGPVLERQLSREPATNALIRTTAAPTMISGGVKANVLPQEATALVNFRIMPGDSIDDVLEHVRGLVGPDVEVALSDSSFSMQPPPLSDPESAEFAVVAAAASEHFELGAVAPWILTGATDSRHFVPLADQVLRFVPLTATADDFKRFHGTGERIRLADADAAVGFYRTLLEMAASGV